MGKERVIKKEEKKKPKEDKVKEKKNTKIHGGPQGSFLL